MNKVFSLKKENIYLIYLNVTNVFELKSYNCSNLLTIFKNY